MLPVFRDGRAVKTPIGAAVDCIAISPSDGDDHDDYVLIPHFIDKAVADAAQFDFVTIGMPRKPGGSYARIIKTFDKFS